MSICSKTNSKKNLLYKSFVSSNIKSKSRSYSVVNSSNISLNKDFYKKPIKIYNSNLSVLNYIMACSERKFSVKTGLSNYSPENLNYDLDMINKYEENLNNSLSFISDFDLENDCKNDIDNSFSSEKDDDSVEIIEITKKISTLDIYGNVNEDNDINILLNKDYNEKKDY